MNTGSYPHVENGRAVLRVMADLVRSTRERSGLSRPVLALRSGIPASRLARMEHRTTPAQDVPDLVRCCRWLDIDPCALIDDAYHQFRKYGSQAQWMFIPEPTRLPEPPVEYRFATLSPDAVTDHVRRVMREAREGKNVSAPVMGNHLGCSDTTVFKMEYRDQGWGEPDPLRVRPFLSYCDALDRSPAALLRSAILAARDVAS